MDRDVFFCTSVQYQTPTDDTGTCFFAVVWYVARVDGTQLSHRLKREAVPGALPRRGRVAILQ